MDHKPTMWDLFILLISVFVLAILAVEFFFPLSEQSSQVVQTADNLICVVFFADFLRSLYRAKDRRRYLLTWGWVDLLSSIPQIEPLRVMRVARVLRIARLLRAVRGTRLLREYLLKRRAQVTASTTVLLIVLILFVGAILIVPLEAGQGGPIDSASDALWWAVTTMTTVGYGDEYPITSGGRILASVLMVTGVAVFAALSGLLASWIVGGHEDPQAAALRAELAEIKETLRRLETHLEQRRAEPQPAPESS